MIFNGEEFIRWNQVDEFKPVRLAFTTQFTYPAPGSFRISNLRLRAIETPRPDLSTDENILAYYSKRLEETGSNAAIHRKIAFAFQGLKRDEEAFKYLAKAADTKIIWYMPLDAGIAAAKLQKYSEAARYFKEAFQQLPEGQFSLISRITKYYVPFLEKIKNLPELDLQPMRELVTQRLQTDNKKESARHCHQLLGEICVAQGDKDSAQEHYQQALKTTPKKRHKVLNSLRDRIKAMP
jgi:tetratricopeptide (TPR) repeat protein